VTAGSLLVAAADVVQAPNDKQQLEPMPGEIGDLPAELGAVDTLLADAGYFSEDNVNACAADGIGPVIAIGRHRRWPRRSTADRKPGKGAFAMNLIQIASIIGAALAVSFGAIGPARQAGLAGQAQAEATGQRVAALANLQRERDEMRSGLETGARQLALTIAARLLGRVPADATTAALLQSLESRLAAVTEEERRTLAGAILPTSL
jgi:hypothetical protein